MGDIISIYTNYKLRLKKSYLLYINGRESFMRSTRSGTFQCGLVQSDKARALKRKTSLCSLLVIIIAISVFSMEFHLVSADNTSTPVLSVVPTGAPGATVNSTQIPAVAVGSTFTVDIRVNNIGNVTPGIDGLSYSLTYDPSVLNVTAFQTKQTSFWGYDSSDITSIVTQVPAGTFTESAIILPSGAPDEATNTPGVATQVTFTVLAAGQSNITFAPSDVGIAFLDYPDSAGVGHDIVASTVDAIYGVLPSPTQTLSPSPTLILTPSPKPTLTTTQSETASTTVSPSSTLPREVLSNSTPEFPVTLILALLIITVTLSTLKFSKNRKARKK